MFIASCAITGLTLTAVAGLTHWPHEWDEGEFGDVDYYAASDDPAPFNTATADSEMGNGRLSWNNVSGAPVLVDYGGTLAMNGFGCPSNAGAIPNGRVYIKGCPITPAGVMHAQVLAGTNRIWKAIILMDTTPSGYTWHVSSSTSVPSGRKDLRGAVAHELGHALGSSHISLDCEALSAQTMCSYHSNGTAKYRSTQAHEQQDFKDRY